MSKTTPKEKEQGYGIRSNKYPSEINFEIFRYALSHMVNASVYVAAAEAQSRGNNDWGLGVDSLVTVRKSKTVSVLPYSCFKKINVLMPSSHQYFISYNATRLRTAMKTVVLVFFSDAFTDTGLVNCNV